MIRVFADTNVLASGLAGYNVPESASALNPDAWRNGHLQLMILAPILANHRRTVTKPYFAQRSTTVEVERPLELTRSPARKVISSLVITTFVIRTANKASGLLGWVSLWIGWRRTKGSEANPRQFAQARRFSMDYALAHASTASPALADQPNHPKRLSKRPLQGECYNSHLNDPNSSIHHPSHSQPRALRLTHADPAPSDDETTNTPSTLPIEVSLIDALH